MEFGSVFRNDFLLKLIDGFEVIGPNSNSWEKVIKGKKNSKYKLFSLGVFLVQYMALLTLKMKNEMT